MRVRTSSSLALTAILFVFALPALAQAPDRNQRIETDFSIRGKLVFGTPHAPDQRIEMRLERGGGEPVQTIYSDSIGNFEFRNLSTGTYYVVVNVEGYEEIRQSVEVYSNMGRVVAVNIFLQEKLRMSAPGPRVFEGDDPAMVDVSSLNLPKKAVSAYEKGLKEREKGNDKAAVRLFEEAVSIAPAFYHAHNNLGILYQRSERYRDAEKSFRRAIEINPRAAQPAVNLGGLFIQEAESRKGEGPEKSGEILDQALDILEGHVKAFPKSALGYYYLGAAFYKSEFFPEAEGALKKSVDLDPSLAQSKLMLINVYSKQLKWDSVLGQINGFLKDHPSANERAALVQMKDKITKGLDEKK